MEQERSGEAAASEDGSLDAAGGLACAPGQGGCSASWWAELCRLAVAPASMLLTACALPSPLQRLRPRLPMPSRRYR